MDYPQDPRTVGMLGGWGPSGEPLPAMPDHLFAVAASWPVSEHTPPEIREQLRVSRDLFTHFLLVWEFSVVGVSWSLRAVESTLRWGSGSARLGVLQVADFEGTSRRAPDGRTH
ncbi:MAG: hypothetical protein WCG47_27905 [Dermatophilaceae bacterium]